MGSAASFQISAAAELVGHEVAEQVLQNSSWPSKAEALLQKKSSLLGEGLLTAGNPAIICAYSLIRAGYRKTQESISVSRQNQIKQYIKKNNVIRNVKGLQQLTEAKHTHRSSLKKKIP